MAIGFVGSAFSTGSTTAGTTKTVTYTPSAGNTLLVWAWGAGSGTNGNVTNVTDTAGNIYYPRSGPNPNNGAVLQASVWSTNPNAALTTAGNVITVTFGGSVRNTIVATEYSGVTGIGSSKTANSTANTSATITQTTQNGNNWIVAGMGVTGVQTWTASVGNLRVSQAGAGSTTPGGAIADNTSVSAGSVTDTVTLSSSGTWVAETVELTTVSNYDEDDTSYPAGVNRSYANQILADSILNAQASSRIGLETSRQQQDDPSGSLVNLKVDEFHGWNPVFLVTSRTNQYYQFLEPEDFRSTIPNGIDEDYSQNFLFPQIQAANPQIFQDNSDFVLVLSFIPDEDVWQFLPATVPSWVVLAPWGDPDYTTPPTPQILDEEYWLTQIRTPEVWVTKPGQDDTDFIFVIPFVPDEDYWHQIRALATSANLTGAYSVEDITPQPGPHSSAKVLPTRIWRLSRMTRMNRS